jgi:hypothetical protein
MRVVGDMGHVPARARYVRLMGRVADVTLDARRHLALHRKQRERHDLYLITLSR